LEKKKTPEWGQFTLTAERHLLDGLREIATKKGYTLKDLIMFVLHEHLENTAQ